MTQQQNVFKDAAQAYWDKGMSAMPLHPKSKIPAEFQWQQYSQHLPSPFEQKHWLANRPSGNIGLVLGEQSRVVIIDVDTDQPIVKNAIESVIPLSPWRRFGAKGYAAAYKYTGEKTFRIKDSEGKMIVECLSTRTQMVLPPSIHPDTNAPYTANCFLPDVVDSLPSLPKDIEGILRGAIETMTDVELSHKGWTRVTDFVSAGSRDVQMTGVAGHYANGVTRGELTLKEAVDRMRAWHETCQEKVAGDDVDVEKGVAKLIEFLTRDVMGPKNKPLPIGWDDKLSDSEKKQLGLSFDEDVEEWTYKKCIDYMLAIFRQYTDRADPKRMEAIQHVLHKISRSPTLSELDQGRILKWINEINKDISMSDLKKQVLSLKTGKMVGSDHSEIARAVIEDLSKFGELRYFQTEFWQWKGSHWEVLEPVHILKHLSEEYGKLPAARKSSDHKGIMSVIQSLLPQVLADVCVKGINFANGFLMLEESSAELRMSEHHTRYGMTYTLPFRYDVTLSGNCPQFLSFLHSMWGNDSDFNDKVQLLREMMAITVFGLGPSFERACLLFGLPHSGKTQLLRIVQALMPEGTCSYIAPYQFNDKFEVTELSQSLLNVCGELSNEKFIEGARFKSVIGGEVMPGQYKGKPLFSFSPKCTHWFASNHLPKTKDMSDGFNRRWAILTFNNQISRENKIRDIGQLIVADEREAIMAWVVEAMVVLAKQPDVTLPESHDRTLQEMVSGNDSVYFWVSTGGVEINTSDLSTQQKSLSTISFSTPLMNGMDSGIHVKDLYENYFCFCSEAALARPVGLRGFSMRLRELAAIKNLKMILPEKGDITQSRLLGVTLRAVSMVG